MTKSIVIEKHIPLPELRGDHTSLPFRALEPGDSFYVADCDAKMRNRVHSAVSYRNREAKRFTARLDRSNGMRVWRII